MRLIGQSVVLRVARAEDADALAQGFADDPTLGAMLGIEPDQENAEWLRKTFRDDGQTGERRKAYWFAIAHPESGEPIGEIGLVGISWPNRRAGLSILVLPGSRRAGIGREATAVLLSASTLALQSRLIPTSPRPSVRRLRARSEPSRVT